MRHLALAALSTLLLVACNKSQPPAEATPSAAPKALVSGIDQSQFDNAIRAQDDFYRHVNGQWLKNNPVPSDKSNYGSFTKLADDAEAQLKKIIEESANAKDKKAGSDEQKVGDYYSAYMNEAKADELGLKPIEAELAAIDALKDRKELGKLFAQMIRNGVNIVPGYIDTDAKNSSQYMLYIFQGGTGLPDRDYYLDQTDEFKTIRAKYKTHIGNMLTLAKVGDAAMAEKILALETQIAEAQWTKVDSRDADKTYNKYEFADLPKLSPNFDWPGFIDGMGVGKSPGIVVSQPSFFTAWDGILQKTELSTIKAWLKWNVLSTYAELLSKPFVDENFAFYGTTLNGITELKPRWKRAVDATESALGEVLGRIYVARHFPPEAKVRMDGLVQNLVKAYEASIKELDWMSGETKAKALTKLGKFTPKIGYPVKWRDYSTLDIDAGKRKRRNDSSVKGN